MKQRRSLWPQGEESVQHSRRGGEKKRAREGTTKIFTGIHQEEILNITELAFLQI